MKRYHLSHFPFSKITLYFQFKESDCSKYNQEFTQPKTLPALQSTVISIAATDFSKASIYFLGCEIHKIICYDWLASSPGILRSRLRFRATRDSVYMKNYQSKTFLRNLFRVLSLKQCLSPISHDPNLPACKQIRYRSLSITCSLAMQISWNKIPMGLFWYTSMPAVTLCKNDRQYISFTKWNLEY